MPWKCASCALHQGPAPCRAEVKSITARPYKPTERWRGARKDLSKGRRKKAAT